MKTILCHVTPRTIAARVRRDLSALGYQLVDATEHAETLDNEPTLRIVDRASRAKVPSPRVSPHTPIVLVVRKGGDEAYDPRVRGILTRPLRLDDVYSVLQESLEAAPRRWPRVSAELPARCLGASQPTIGAVLSLSQNGCLFRGTAHFDPATHLRLQLALPRGDVITTEARCAYIRGDGIGIEFDGSQVAIHEPIARYVSGRLAA